MSSVRVGKRTLDVTDPYMPFNQVNQQEEKENYFPIQLPPWKRYRTPTNDVNPPPNTSRKRTRKRNNSQQEFEEEDTSFIHPFTSILDEDEFTGPLSMQSSFSPEQVHFMLSRALVRAHEQCLQGCTSQLQDQFEQFSNFNRDYISRSTKQGDLSYLS